MLVSDVPTTSMPPPAMVFPTMATTTTTTTTTTSTLTIPGDFALALASLHSFHPLTPLDMLAISTAHGANAGCDPSLFPNDIVAAGVAPHDLLLPPRRRPSLAGLVFSSSTPESDYGARRGSLASLLTSDGEQTEGSSGGLNNRRTSIGDLAAFPPPPKSLSSSTPAAQDKLKRKRRASSSTQFSTLALPGGGPSQHHRLLRRQAKALARVSSSAEYLSKLAAATSTTTTTSAPLMMSAGGFSFAEGFSSSSSGSRGHGHPAPPSLPLQAGSHYAALNYSHAAAASPTSAPPTTFPSSSTTTSSSSFPTPQLYDPMIHGQRPMPSSPPPSRSAANHPMTGGGVGGGGIGGLMIDIKPDPSSLGHFQQQRYGQPHQHLSSYPHSTGPPPSQMLPSSLQVPQRPKTANSLGRGAGGSSGSETTTTSGHQQQHHAPPPPPQQLQASKGDDMVMGPDGLHVPVGVSGGKLFRCMGFEGCEMTFTRSEHLARHVRKHTGERPFPCHCGKSFSRLDNLRQHAATVHSDQTDLNARMLHTLAPVHAALSQRAGKDQKRRGEVLELAKQQQAASKQQGQAARGSLVGGGGGSHAASPYPPHASSSFQYVSGASSQHRKVKDGRHPVSRSVSGMPVPPPLPRAVHQQRFYDAQAGGGSSSSSSLPPSTAGSIAGWDHQPPPPLPPAGALQRPESSAGRPVTSGSTYRPMTGIEAARPMSSLTGISSRPRTSALPKSSRPADESDPNFAYDPMPYASQSAAASTSSGQHIASHSVPSLPADGSEDVRRRQQPHGYGFDPSQLQRNNSNAAAASAWTDSQSSLYHSNPQSRMHPSQLVYSSSSIPPYSGVPPSTAPATAPFQYQFGSAPSFGHTHHQQTAAAGGISGPASQSQIQQIYGNSAGAQEDPFSYHPPPTATLPPQNHGQPNAYATSNGGGTSVNYSAAGTLSQGQSLQSSTMHRDPTLASHRDDSSQNGLGHEFEYGDPYRQSRPPYEANPQETMFTLQSGLGERRSSLAISSLLADDVPVMMRKQQQQQGPPPQQHEQAFYPSQQQQDTAAGDVDDMQQGYGFNSSQSNNNGGGGGGSFDGRFAYSDVASSSWEPHQQQHELVGAMDAKAKALLGGGAGGQQYGM